MLLAVVSVLFIGYKYISSAIDEQRQKAIEDKKLQAIEQQRNELLQCLDTAKGEFDRKVKTSKEFGWYDMQHNGLSLDQVNSLTAPKIEADKKQMEVDKQECYQIYK